MIATGFKPVTGWSVVSYSIQLSYATLLSIVEVTATGFKPVTGWSVVSYSIQLSYAAILFSEKVIATGFKPVTGWSVVSYSIQLSYAAIVSWLRVQRYVFVLNMQTFRLLFCEFNLTFLDWRSGNQCLSQSWNSPSDNCIRWRTDWYIRMAIAIRPPLHPYN